MRLILPLLALAACDSTLKEDAPADSASDSGVDTGASDTSDTRDTSADTSPDTGDTSVDTGDTGDTGGGDTSDTGATGPGCRSASPSADRDRTVLVSLPYTASGGQADRWARMTLSRAGSLSDTGTRLTMGRATYGNVVFTPDGSLAIAATERGALAVYDVTRDTVIDAAWDGGFSASSLTMDPSGEVVWVVDGNWPNNGGGLWRVALDCTTGAPGDAERVLEAKNPAKLVLLGGSRAALVGREVPGTRTGDDLAWLDWGRTITVDGGADAFGDDDAIVSDAILAGDTVLVGDNSSFSEVPNRVARVGLDGEVATTVAIEDPFAMAPFPDGSDRALVASGFGDALYVLDASTGRTTTVSTSPRVQIPGSMVHVTRGALTGLTLVSEVGGVRLVQLSSSGAADRGVTSLGSGMDGLPGAIGVAP